MQMILYYIVIQADLISLNNWGEKNKLTINCKKEEDCIYGMRSMIRKSRNIDMLLSLNNVALEKVCSYKYQLNFNKHMSELVNIVSHMLYLL